MGELTDVSHGVFGSLERFDLGEVGGGEGVEVVSDVGKQLLVWMVLDATVVVG